MIIKIIILYRTNNFKITRFKIEIGNIALIHMFKQFSKIMMKMLHKKINVTRRDNNKRNMLNNSLIELLIY